MAGGTSPWKCYKMFFFALAVTVKKDRQLFSRKKCTTRENHGYASMNSAGAHDSSSSSGSGSGSGNSNDIGYIFNNSAADCLISVKFDT